MADDMFNNDLKVYVQHHDFGRRVGIALVEETYVERKLTETMLLLGEAPAELEEGRYGKPTFSLTEEKAQDLFNGLYECGFRPKEEGQAVGEMAGMRGHLADMRRIASHFSKCELP